MKTHQTILKLSQSIYFWMLKFDIDVTKGIIEVRSLQIKETEVNKVKKQTKKNKEW